MTPSIPLRALIVAIWAAIHPAAPKLLDASEIADAITTAVNEDHEQPVFGSREEDAAIMAYYALRESWLAKGAVGDHGRSFGVWQEPAITGRADVLTQARAWLVALHEGARICPASPAAPLTGGCNVARSVANRRVARARALLAQVRQSLATSGPLASD